MATSHDRRLDRLEGICAPAVREVFIWDDYTAGCVDREIARRTSAGLIGSGDRIITIGWMTENKQNHERTH